MAFRDFYARFDAESRRPSASRGAARGYDNAPTPSGASGLLAILWRRKPTIAATLAVFALGGIAYIAATPPRYLAATSILIDPQVGKTIGNEPVQPGVIADAGTLDSQIKLLTSRTVLSRVAKTTHLADDPEFNGADRSLVQRILNPGLPLEDGVDLNALEDAITVKRLDQADVVSLAVLARNPEKAADLANALTKVFIDDQVRSRVGSARDDTHFARQQLVKLSAAIKDADDKIEAFKTTNAIVDAGGFSSNEQQITDLTKALGEARAKAADAKTRIAEIRLLQRRGRLDGSSEALTSLTIERLRQEQAETSQNAARLAMTLGPRHPDLIEARERESKIEKLIRDELKRVAEATEADYKAAVRNEAQIAAEVERLEQRSTEVSRSFVPLIQLKRDVTALRASFDRYSQIHDNIRYQGADSPRGRVISVAKPPASPAQPEKTIVAVISLSAGLVFGLAASLLAESRSSNGPRRESSAEFERSYADDVFEEPDTYEVPRSYRRPAPPRARAPEPKVADRAPPDPPKPHPRPMRRYWDDDDS